MVVWFFRKTFWNFNIILSLHDYEVCEVSVYDIADANKEWLSWIDEEVGE